MTCPKEKLKKEKEKKKIFIAAFWAKVYKVLFARTVDSLS